VQIIIEADAHTMSCSQSLSQKSKERLSRIIILLFSLVFDINSSFEPLMKRLQPLLEMGMGIMFSLQFFSLYPKEL